MRNEQHVAESAGSTSSGIEVIGQVPWGTHFCHFYETAEDLLDILVPYFKAGLEAHEFCVWVVYEPLTEARAREALRLVMADVDQRVASGDLLITPHSEWYLPTGAFDPRKTADRWMTSLDDALGRGYAGLRVNAIDTWVAVSPPAIRKEFAAYEQSLNNLIAGKRMLVACTYSVAESTAVEMLDVARTHQFAVARRKGQWEVLEAPELAETKAALERLNAELESRVDARTRQLAEANAALERTTDQLRALAANHRSQREAHDGRIARELHDELGSELTSLKWSLESIHEAVVRRDGGEVEQKLEDLMRMADRLLDSVRRIASGLRPTMLDDLGLPEAIEWQAQEFRRQTGIPCVCSIDVEVQLASERSTAVHRIVQEALTNVARHAEATAVEIGLRLRDDELIVTIRDDGRGIGHEEVSRRQSLGLLGMQERARLSGGTFRIEGWPSKGTRVEVRMPTHG